MICSFCKFDKPFKDFKKDSRRLDGLSSWCKACHNYKARLFNKSLEGKVHSMFRGQINSSATRGHPAPTYTLEALKTYLLSDKLYVKLWREWVASGYNKLKAPSLDRLDNTKPYSFDNIRLGTWQDNLTAYYQDVYSGINSTALRSVDKLTLSKEYIETYPSLEVAARSVGLKSSTGIHAVCKGSRHKSGGFSWRYSTINLRGGEEE